jgi:hypothetical protein
LSSDRQASLTSSTTDEKGAPEKRPFRGGTHTTQYLGLNIEAGMSIGSYGLVCSTPAMHTHLGTLCILPNTPGLGMVARLLFITVCSSSSTFTTAPPTHVIGRPQDRCKSLHILVHTWVGRYLTLCLLVVLIAAPSRGRRGRFISIYDHPCLGFSLTAFPTNLDGRKLFSRKDVKPPTRVLGTIALLTIPRLTRLFLTCYHLSNSVLRKPQQR